MTERSLNLAPLLSPIIVAGRGDALRQRFVDIDALLVTDLTNLRWLTGFTGSNGVGVVLDDRIVLVTDGRYGEQAQRQLHVSGCNASVEVGRTAAELFDIVVGFLDRVAHVGFESAHTSYQRYQQFDAAVSGSLVPTVGLIEVGRRTKDVAEIARIQRACQIADQALAAVVPAIAPGTTEAAIRNELERQMREFGASGPSYETIVATGRVNAPMPHHRPTSTPVQHGDTVIIDVGALVDGYHSDMTRTFVVGRPTELQQQVYDVVLTAQCAGVAAVRPGLTTRQLDAVCRDIITEAGFGPWFSHGTGHGVGLLIHEDPFVNSAGELELQVGDVVTVEPGVYRGDFGGVRVEDLVEVTSSGCRVLTESPKDVPCLPSVPTI